MDSGVLSSPEDVLEATLHESLENMIVINTVEYPTLMRKDRVIQHPSSRTTLFCLLKGNRPSLLPCLLSSSRISTAALNS